MRVYRVLLSFCVPVYLSICRSLSSVDVCYTYYVYNFLIKQSTVGNVSGFTFVCTADYMRVRVWACADLIQREKLVSSSKADGFQVKGSSLSNRLLNENVSAAAAT